MARSSWMSVPVVRVKSPVTIPDAEKFTYMVHSWHRLAESSHGRVGREERRRHGHKPRSVLPPLTSHPTLLQ